MGGGQGGGVREGGKGVRGGGGAREGRWQSSGSCSCIVLVSFSALCFQSRLAIYSSG